MRRWERIGLIYYLRIFDAKSNEIVGHLVNVNPEGIMLISDHPLKTGDRRELAMDLPGHLRAGKQMVFTGEVIWSKAQLGTPFHNTGVRLVSVSEKQQEMLAQMMRDFDSGGIGLNVSDEINPPELLHGNS